MTTAVHKNLIVLARMLERLERSPVAVDAQQYRTVVQHLSRELGAVQGDPHLEMVLEGFPATAELYENLQYRHAGLCRSPLELSLSAEMDARQLIEQARARARAAQPKR